MDPPVFLQPPLTQSLKYALMVSTLPRGRCVTGALTVQIKPFLSLTLVALTSLLFACAQPGGPGPRPAVASAPAQPTQQELDLREYQMLRSSVQSQVFAIQYAHDLAWYAVHDAGGIRNHAGCYTLPPALLSSPMYDQFSQLMTMEYRGRCVTEVTTRAKNSQP